MEPLTMAGIGALLGLAKSEFLDKNNANTQRKLQAEIARYSPWTGMQASAVDEADPLGSAMQGAFAGGSFGQSLAASNQFGNKGATSLAQGAQAEGAAGTGVPQSEGPTVASAKGSPQTFADALASLQQIQTNAQNNPQFFSPYMYMGTGRR